METRHISCALTVLCLCGCAASTRTAPVLPTKTTLVTASARCRGGSCECRTLDSDEGQAEEGIPSGQKRFEFRLPRTTSAVWVTVEGKGVFYKPPEDVQPACFYLDLGPGEHKVAVHSERRDVEVGLQTGLAVSEYGPKVSAHWYRSLDFVCGGGNKCTKEAMESWVVAQRQLPRGILDPCGSTLIRGVTFGGAREERLLPEYVDLDLRFSMKVYGFETRRSPGSPECRALGTKTQE
jgi:hypothetical protein